jgi:tellurite resistance protein
MIQPLTLLSNFGTALHEAGTKINIAVRELKRREDEASSWMQRFIYREIEQRTRTRGPAYWDQAFPGLDPEARAQRRIRRMLTRATVAGVAAAAGASTAEVLSVTTEGIATVAAVPLGLVSIGAEMLYTMALQIDLAFDLASIYDVPFAHDDVGEIATLLGLSLGVDLVVEPSQHDKPLDPSAEDETKLWRVMRQMQRADFSHKVAREVVQQSVLRNVVPVAGILVSAVWNQVVLRRFAGQVHTAVRQRLAIVRACRHFHLGDHKTARTILDGAWLLATSDGALDHQEALALATLIDSLTLPERIAVHDASFSDDQEEWFDRARQLEPSAQSVLVDVLSLVASADGVLTVPERRFLLRLARVLNRQIDLPAIERMVANMRNGSTESASADIGATPSLTPMPA